MDNQGYMATCGECNAVDIGGRINHYPHCSRWDGKTGRKVSVSSAHAKPQWEQIEDLQKLSHDAQAESDRRLALLRECNNIMPTCPKCKGNLRTWHKIDENQTIRIGHADGCEMDAECNG